MDQDALTALDARKRLQRVLRGEEHDRQAGGAHEVEVVGHHRDRVRGCDDVRGERGPRDRDDRVAGPDASDARAHGPHDATALASGLERPRTDILAFTMPGFATSEHTRNNATRLAETLGVSFATLDITGTARTMRRIARVTGRSDDMMIVRGVNVFPTQIEEQILKVKGLAPHYVVVLTREGRMDEMEVLVERSGGIESDPAPESALAHLIKSLCGVTARVTGVETGGVERSQGTVSYTHLRAHETVLELVGRLLLEKKNI